MGAEEEEMEGRAPGICCPLKRRCRCRFSIISTRRSQENAITFLKNKDTPAPATTGNNDDGPEAMEEEVGELDDDDDDDDDRQVPAHETPL